MREEYNFFRGLFYCSLFFSIETVQRLRKIIMMVVVGVVISGRRNAS
jgi:hypothetical protein